MNKNDFLFLAELINCQVLVAQAHPYSVFNHIRNMMRGEAPTKALWSEHYRYRSLPPNIQNEITFNDCVDTEIHIKSAEVQIKMWDGDSMYGHRKYHRCEWTYMLTDEVAELFTNMLFQKVAEKAVFDEEMYRESLVIEAIDHRYRMYLKEFEKQKQENERNLDRKERQEQDR